MRKLLREDLRYVLNAFALVLILSVAGCASDKDALQAELPDTPVETLYNNAASQLDAGEYTKSITGFDEVERQHPYSQWATRAQLMSVYAAYKAQKYDIALVGVDRFIRMNPGNKDIDYAYYLRGLAYYEQVSDIKRDQSMAQAALQSFNAVITQFPDSTYARDARLKRDLLQDHLAGKSMDIGRYYLKRDIPTASIPRFLDVVRNYQTTTHVPEALYRLTESYLRVGLNTEATRAAAVLGYNYPGSFWYEKAYGLLLPGEQDKINADKQAKRSLWGQAIDTLF